jgi:integrase
VSRKSLTQLAIEKLRPDPAKVIERSDHLYPALRLIVQPSGSRSFAVRTRINGRTVKLTLGGEVGLDLKAAREATRKLLEEIAAGHDPRADKRRAKATTLKGVAELYLKDVAGHTRAKTHGERVRHLIRDWAPLHHRPLAELRKAEIAGRLLELKEELGGISANRARATLHAMMSWAIDQGLGEFNVVASVKRPLRREPTRARVLTPDERRAVWAATEGAGAYHCIVRVLMLTGQRREEVAGMRWSEIDLDKAMWSLAPERTKNALSHLVPLSRQALELIRAQPRQGDYVFGAPTFGGWSRAKRRLDKRSGVTGWTIHDIRRSTVTGMADELGVAPAVIEAVINHQSGVKAGVAGVYDRSQRLGERATALQRWADHLTSEPARTVVDFPAAHTA